MRWIQLRSAAASNRRFSAANRKPGEEATCSTKPRATKTKTARCEQEMSWESESYAARSPLCPNELSVCKGKRGSQTKRRNFKRLQRGVGRAMRTTGSKGFI